MTSIFTRIIKGELPSYKLHEDEWTISILTIEPIRLGHSLVIPKIEVDHFFEVPEPYYTKVFENSKNLSLAIKKATGCKRVGTIIQGFEVPHCHHHLIPVNQPSDMSFSHAHKEPEDKMKEIQEKIISFL